MPAALTLIDTLPRFISPDEHKTLIASTPASFNDIPPVLHHTELNVAITLDPPFPAFEAEDCAKGTLYVVESVLAFISVTGRGFQVEYPSITLHAVSRTEVGPSIYCQLDESDPTKADADEDETTPMRELSLIPEDPSSLEAIFEALSICASLHPSTIGLSDDDSMDGTFDDADEVRFDAFTGNAEQELSQVGRAALEHLESIIVYPRAEANGDEGADEDAEGSEEDAEPEAQQPIGT